MAGAGYKLFQTGDVLTAAQVNTYLNEQTVMVFANAAARTSALTSVLAEGMVSYLQDTNAVEVYNGSAWVGVSGTGDVTEVQAGTGISVASGTGPIPVVTNTMATAVDAKGDLIVGTGADTFARLAVGTNGHTLVADSAETTGLKWQAPASGSTGPAFRAFRNTSSQSISATTATKVQLNAETFDTDNCFDSTTNYRFTPTTAGYYQITGGIEASSTSGGYIGAFIYKNGSRVATNRQDPYASGSHQAQVTDLIYLNGSSDYIELYAFINGGSSITVSFGTDETYFCGAYIHS